MEPCANFTQLLTYADCHCSLVFPFTLVACFPHVLEYNSELQAAESSVVLFARKCTLYGLLSKLEILCMCRTIRVFYKQ
ncbi:hypothetical protein I79_017693 [Cricetulus griseus]|uniref:Uncharacterized protein n=1 Tax=Cricetulus griseus TaxID=10029 RepID=G3I2Q0_CRIGR|nr:hypothetical protein I79_017693 [Cricetulus griseus]